MSFNWQLLIDWDGNGSFYVPDPEESVGPGDPPSELVTDWLSLTWRLGMRRAYQLVADEAEATIVLRNRDGKYNPESTTSLLAGMVRAGRRVQIGAVKDGATIVMFDGKIERIEPEWKPGGAAGKTFTRLICTGRKTSLQDTPAAGRVYQNVRTDEVVSDQLASVGLYGPQPAGNTFLYSYVVGAGRSVWDVLHEMAETERGRLRESRWGEIAFHNRQDLLRDPTVSYTVGSGQAIEPIDVSYSFGRTIANEVQIIGEQVTFEAAAVELWRLANPVQVPPGEVISFEATLQTADGQTAAATALQIGSQVIDGGSCSITIQPRGEYADVTISNAGTDTALVTSLTLEGAPVTRRHAVQVKIEDAASIAENGRHTFKLHLTSAGGYDLVRQTAIYELEQRKDARGVVESITFGNYADGVANEPFYSMAFGQKIRVILPEFNHNAVYLVIGEQHSTRGPDHFLTLYLEPADPNRYWLLETAGYSELNNTTRLGY